MSHVHNRCRAPSKRRALLSAPVTPVSCAEWARLADGLSFRELLSTAPLRAPPLRNLDQNALSVLPARALAGLGRLEVLSLAANRLTAPPADALRPLHALREL
ncbi:Protein of unknown function [Gryllus bimaculatus]|nr:Protein of unknown function [Gryllus bimaculatus]